MANQSDHPSEVTSSVSTVFGHAPANIAIPTPAEIVALLSRHVIGQEDAKRVLAVAAYQHFVNCAMADLHGRRMQPENNVLLVGPTGSGKSMLLKCLKDILNCPLIFISCTNITPDGYKGKNFDQHLDSIAKEIARDEITRPAVVVYDEVDKLAIPSKSNFAEEANVYKRMTQTNFLTYLDGNKCGDDGELDASRILNIAIGAFVGIDEIRKPKTIASLGFHQIMADQMSRESPSMVTADHLIAYGLIPEFVGRFSRIASLETLDHSALRRILTEAEGNVLSRRKDFYAIHGVKLEVTNDAIDQLIQSALTEGTGGRALRVVVDRMLRSVEHRLPDLAIQGIHALIYNRAAVLGETGPIELRSTPSNPEQLIELRRHAAYAKQGGADPSPGKRSLDIQ